MIDRDFEEAAKRYSEGKSSSSVFKEAHKLDFINGAKWQQERSYSEKDMIEFSKFCQTDEFECRAVNKSLLELFEQFKKK